MLVQILVCALCEGHCMRCDQAVAVACSGQLERALVAQGAPWKWFHVTPCISPAPHEYQHWHEHSVVAVGYDVQLAARS